MRTATLTKLAAMLVAAVAAAGIASVHPRGAPAQEPGGEAESGSAQDPEDARSVSGTRTSLWGIE